MARYQGSSKEAADIIAAHDPAFAARIARERKEARERERREWSIINHGRAARARRKKYAKTEKGKAAQARATARYRAKLRYGHILGALL